MFLLVCNLRLTEFELCLQVDWCFGDETVERLSLEGVEGGELEAAVANHNLLLSNIHKMEGEWKEGL